MSPDQLVWDWVSPDITLEVDIISCSEIVWVQGLAQSQRDLGLIWGGMRGMVT